MNDSRRLALVIVLLLIAFPLLWGVGMMGGMGFGMMDGGWSGDGWNPWQGFLSMLSMLLIIGGIVAIVWWAFGRTSGAGASPRAPDDARDVLDERYARGELTREQYQQMRRDLES